MKLEETKIEEELTWKENGRGANKEANWKDVN
jgi:hypothetical protein